MVRLWRPVVHCPTACVPNLAVAARRAPGGQAGGGGGDDGSGEDGRWVVWVEGKALVGV